MKYDFYLNGSKISSKRTFFKEISNVIFPNFEWKYGYDYDILSDILDGGYGLIYSYEHYNIHWQNFKNSAKKMDKETLFDILSSFDGMANISLVLE